MRKILFLLACAAALSGCMTDEGSHDNTKVKYREIRVDAFTHYWESRRLSADSVRGDTLWSYGEKIVLANRALYKPGSQPAHTLDTTREDVLYKTKEAPEGGFSCFAEVSKNFEASDSASADIWHRYFDEDAWVVDGEKIAPNSRGSVSWRVCEYYPGEGFRITSRAEVGTYVIRY